MHSQPVLDCRCSYSSKKHSPRNGVSRYIPRVCVSYSLRRPPRCARASPVDYIYRMYQSTFCRSLAYFLAWSRPFPTCHAAKSNLYFPLPWTINSHVQGSKTLLGGKVEVGEGSSNHRNHDVGFLAALRTMIFGARDPESDLSTETLEELHMVTGCESARPLAACVAASLRRPSRPASSRCS